MAFELAGKIGVRFVKLSVAFGVGGLFVYKFAPHIFPSQICKGFLQFPDQPLPESCHLKFKEVSEKLSFNNAEKIELFLNGGFYGISAGVTWLPNGAVVGVPRWYIFQNGEDVENSKLNFMNRAIKWNSELGQQMKESLVPTEDNIAFTLAHELAHLQRTDFKLCSALMAPSWLYATYKLAERTPRFAPRLTTIFDIILKLCICRLSYIGYRRANKELQQASERNADEVAARADISFAYGGVDLLSKRMALNRCLRALHGKTGKDYYTEQGDEVETFEHPHLSERLQMLETIINEHKAAGHV